MLSVEQAKTALRIAHDRLDDEIEETIASCILDLSMANVSAEKEDALVDMAERLYCRWKYDYGGKAAQYEQAYTALKQAMSLCGDYQRGRGDV